MKTLGTSDADLREAGAMLARGGLVAFPTETVYGLGANAFDERAVARIFEAKRRPSFDPLIVHLPSADALDEVAYAPEGAGKALIQALWPGPLTLVLRKKARVPGIVTSGLDTVAVRVPAPEITRRLLAFAGVPVAAPSANRFGRLSPTLPSHVAKGLAADIDALVDGGSCAIGVESTIVDVTADPPVVLRPGGLDIARIAEVVGKIALFDRAVATPKAPGQLPNHYAPRMPLRLFAHASLPRELARVERTVETPIPRGTVAIVFSSVEREALENALGATANPFASIETLSEKGDFIEASARMFALLHELEDKGVAELWVEKAPATSLGVAINDRLWKARAK